MKITKPALLAAISYLIMSMAIVLPFNIGDGMKYSFGHRFLLLILMIVPIILSVYSINCMWVGKCYIWSWVNAAVIAGWVLLFILAVVLASSRAGYQVGNLTLEAEESFMDREYEDDMYESFSTATADKEDSSKKYTQKEMNDRYKKEYQKMKKEGKESEIPTIWNKRYVINDINKDTRQKAICDVAKQHKITISGCNKTAKK